MKITGLESDWYDNVPVGRDTLNEAMKTLSKDADLSQKYTNHCIRATTVTNLNEKGFEAKDIMATTGHKSENSIKAYVSRCPENKCRKMSEALAEPLKKKKTKSTETVSVAPADDRENIELLNAAEAPKVNNNEIEFEELDIPDDQIADIFTQIEKENQTVAKAPQPNNPQILNVSNVNNVANVATANKNPILPSPIQW